MFKDAKLRDDHETLKASYDGLHKAHNELVAVVNELIAKNAKLEDQVRELATRPIERIIEKQIAPAIAPVAKPRQITRPVASVEDHIALVSIANQVEQLTA